MISNKSYESIINSEQYKCGLEETLSSMLNKCNYANSEATVASIFENSLHHFIKTQLNIDLVFYKEASSNYFRHKFEGRTDAISNSLIIEYKDTDKLQTVKLREKASKQVIEYMEQLNTDYQAILTNGKIISYFYYQDGNIIHQTPFRDITYQDLDRIVKILISIDNKRLVPQNIVKDFSINRTGSVSLKLLNSLFQIIENNMSDKTNMLFQEWETLFRLSESDSGQNQDIVKRKRILKEIFNSSMDSTQQEYKALYVLQTTYAIIVKLIAAKMISKLYFNKDIMYFDDLSSVSSEDLQTFFEKLETGYVFSAGGIRNLLEGDFFSWYSDSNQWNDSLAESIKETIIVLEEYSSVSLTNGFATIDIFKDLYMEVMPNEVRHSLGEYFTPSWLADQIAEKALRKLKSKKWKAIDPCCGSGIFIVTLIRKILDTVDLYTISDTEKNKLIEDITQRVYGVDINPLSVLTARVSYYLALYPLINNQKFEIPIYLGDTADIPQIIKVGDIKCYKYTIKTKQQNIVAILPCTFVDSPDFSENMNHLQTLIKAEDKQLLYRRFRTLIKEENINEEIDESICELSETLVQLHENNWDGIWVRILNNFMMVARIKEMDLIIGNPPWVKWEFLPQQYAENIKTLCVDKDLFSGQTYMGAISLNLCALIANVTATAWLKEDGLLSFIMPKTLMTQDSYAGFRNFYINKEKNKRLYLQEVDDWSKSGNPFIVTTEKFMTYFYSSKVVNYAKGFPVTMYSKKRGYPIKEINYANEFQTVEKYFDTSITKAIQLDETRTGYTILSLSSSYDGEDYQKIVGTSDYKARSGVEFTPAEVYFIEPIGKVDNSDETYFFKNSTFQNSIYKSLTNGRLELETKYVKPVVKSPCIEEFSITESNNYCIFPYEYGNRESVQLEELTEKATKISSYLIENKPLITRQSNRSRSIAMGNDFYSLSKVGNYTFFKHAVTFRDNTEMKAAVVKEVETPWGEKVMPICAKHSPYISMDKKGNFITEKEAYYLCGILNTPIVKQYFKDTFSGRSYSINFNIKMPKYDENNANMRNIVELSVKASQNNEHKEKYIKEIEKNYIELCESI